MTVETPPPATTPAPPAASPQPGGPATPPPDAPPPDKSSLSKQLFPDFYDKDGKLMDKPTKADLWHPGAKPAPVAKAPAAPATPAPATPPNPPPPASPPAPPSTPEYLDLAQISGKKIKFKDGEREWEASIADVVKNHQLDAHLTQKAQKLADKERDIQALVAELRMVPPDGTPPTPPAPPKPGEPPASPPAQPPARKPDETADAYIKRLESRLANVEEATQEQRMARNLQNLGSQIATETGHADFMDFVPEIRKIVLAKVKDPKHPTPDELFYDTPQFYRAAFMELKLKKISGGGNSTPPAPASPGEPPPAPVRPAPVIPAGIEPGGGSPSAPGGVDDWQQRYEAAHERAVKSGTEEDWQEVIRLKFEKPSQ